MKTFVPEVYRTQLEFWESAAHKTEKNPSEEAIKPRRYSKYFYSLFCPGGGIIGASYAIEDVDLMFMYEECSWSHLRVTIPRYLIGITFVVLVLFPSLFVIPNILTSHEKSPSAKFTWRKALAVFVLYTASFVSGIWYNYTSPKLADILGFSCASFKSATKKSISRIGSCNLETHNCRIHPETPEQPL